MHDLTLNEISGLFGVALVFSMGLLMFWKLGKSPDEKEAEKLAKNP